MVAFSPDGQQAYVAAAELTGFAGTLHVFNPATGALIDSKFVGVLPTGIAVSPDGQRVFITNNTDNTVSVYNTATGNVVSAFATVGTAPTGIAIGPDGARVYVVNSGGNSISVLDATTGTGVTFLVGTTPIAVAINPQGTTAYVGNAGVTPEVVEIGGMRTLTVALSGRGIGTVRSTNVAGIDCGTLAGTSRLWLEPEVLTGEAPMIGNIQIILDGRFALFLYQSAVEGESQLGLFTFGYNTLSDRYEASWGDSWHNNTAIMFCVGTSMENGFSVLGSYPDPTGGPDWGWRTVVELLDNDHPLITAYNISPEGGEARATEARLTRVKK